jgi:hypothetical protein
MKRVSAWQVTLCDPIKHGAELEYERLAGSVELKCAIQVHRHLHIRRRQLGLSRNRTANCYSLWIVILAVNNCKALIQIWQETNHSQLLDTRRNKEETFSLMINMTKNYGMLLSGHSAFILFFREFHFILSSKLTNVILIPTMHASVEKIKFHTDRCLTMNLWLRLS